MGRLRAASLVLAALAAGLLLVACGGSSDKLLPAPTVDSINSHLDQVRASHEEGNCEKAEEGVANVSTEVDELGNVDAKLKKAMRQAAERLSEVVSSCKAEEEEKALAAEEKALEKQAEVESEEQAEFEEEEALEEQKDQELEEKAEEKAQEQAEKEAEQPGPEESEEGPPGKAKGHEKQEEIEPPIPGEEEVTPPGPGGGSAGGIGPGAEAGGP